MLLALMLCAGSVLAQEKADAPEAQTTTTPIVTALASTDGVRFVAPTGVLGVRLEIYNAGGEMISDSGMRAGSIIDWKVSDAKGALADGSYLTVVTIKDFQGKLRQRLGNLSLKAGRATVIRMRSGELTAAQSQTLSTERQSRKIEATETAEPVSVLGENKERAVTVSTHNGTDGQITSTSGALTFRTGNIFNGTDKEQARVTPDGRVGIGTDKPEATLDVAGTIRARDGIMFKDGTMLTSASDLNKQVTAVGGVAPSSVAASSGTTGNIAKFVDGPNGVVGNSTIVENNGNIGIGVTNPQYPLHISSPTFAQLYTSGGTAADFLMYHTAAPTNSRWTGLRSQDGKGKISSFNDSGTYRIESILTWDNATGNVGVGTFANTQKFEVLGNMKINGAGNGLIFPDGSVMTTAGAGGTPSGTNVVSAINDPATSGTINDSRLSGNVARLNGANLWSGTNTFSAGLNANGAIVSGVGNPVNAGDATNKAYVDGGFVKFVPGAEQLSVGDANGTAPMINLRGGSTCCSGPGGHTPAWFKVFQNGSFVATGNLGIGVSPMQGKGYRTSWDSYKGAFRSGYADAEWDDANVGFFSWAGGSNSTAIGLYALAFGDTNQAESTSSIVFGSGNQVKGAAGFSAGAGNRVCDTYGVALGNNAKSGGPLINGKCDPDSFNLRGLAAVAIGYNVTADQDHTMALGKFASNNGFSGTFIWGDGSATASADTFRNTANNEFAARATGGFRFRTNLTGTTGCNLPAGSGVFNCTSSRYTKQNFMMVNGENVLSTLRNVPVSTWNYISEGKQVRHLGPMAEDFYKAFGLGVGNTSIGVQDLAGVSLAAVKALDARTAELQEKAAEVEQLRVEVNELKSVNASMEQRLAALEQTLKANASQTAQQERR
jgi:hypothetical protein